MISLLPWIAIGWTVGNAIGWIDMNVSKSLPLPTRIWHWIWYRWRAVLGVWAVTLLIIYFGS